ncbi:hypothetical protein GOP47_0012143 [Adiantum capillus-veneris]|uniref:Glycosyltransferase n=1 Tax=Adiantum capillus-veneris TaxID=13818 RepID=A0A9D4ZFE4_ADICA|nr:hypothetical protein GOP47_0012143 [Adiantum capillus-veneris]
MPTELRVHRKGFKHLFHTALTATDYAHNRSQCRIVYRWFKHFKDLPDSEMGGFTRVLHSAKPDSLIHKIPTFVVDPLPPEATPGHINGTRNRLFGLKGRCTRQFWNSDFSQSNIISSANTGKSGRRLLCLPALLLLVFLLISFLLRCSSYLSLYDPHIHHGPGIITGRRFSGSTGALNLQAHFVEAEPLRKNEVGRAGVIRDAALDCDRSHMRTDVCVGRGDVRVLGGRQSERLYEVVVYAEAALGQDADYQYQREERVKPYTRKWEESVMNTIDEVKLLSLPANKPQDQHAYVDHDPPCDVQHTAPAILFSTGGYTGNVYHEFNDGLIPLFLTAHHHGGQVVLLLLEYHHWWISKYAEILGQLTNYPIIDLAADKRVHCFPEVTVGLRIHDELSIDPPQHTRGASMAGFQSILHAAYLPRLKSLALPIAKKPKLVIIARDGSRALLNQQLVGALAEEIGFEVQVLHPTPTTEMAQIYGALSGCDTMLGVHGAAMTHLLFMRPGATFIQVVPLGTDWAAATYYGEPARKLGLKYVEYKVRPQESSLWQHYASDDPVLMDPESVNLRGGWKETKRIYLQAQNVTVSLPAMAALLRAAHTRASAKPLDSN